MGLLDVKLVIELVAGASFQSELLSTGIILRPETDETV